MVQAVIEVRPDTAKLTNVIQTEEEYSFIKSLTERNDIQSRQGDCHAGQHYKVDINIIYAWIYIAPCPTQGAQTWIKQFYLQITLCMP